MSKKQPIEPSAKRAASQERPFMPLDEALRRAFKTPPLKKKSTKRSKPGK